MTMPDPDDPHTPTVRSTTQALGGFALILVAVAVITVIVVGGSLFAIGWFFSADTRTGGTSNSDEFTAFAEDLPGVQLVDTRFGLADTFVDVTDVYATVALDDDCTRESMTETAANLRGWIASHDQPLRVHPTLSCAGARVTVSPAATVTADRFQLLDALLADPAIATAGVLSHQQGDDAHHDESNTEIAVEVGIEADATVSAVLETWISRSAEFAPRTQLAVGSGLQPDHEYVSLLPGMRRVSVVTDGTPMPELIAATSVVEGIDSAEGFLLQLGYGTSELRVLLGDAAAHPDVLARLSPIAGQFNTVEVVTR